MKRNVISLKLILIAFTTLTAASCTKEAAKENVESIEPILQAQVKTTFNSTTWIIDEVTDPNSGLRFKRGVFSDGKRFDIAYYNYNTDGTVTGRDWSDNVLTNTRYTWLNNGKILKVVYPACEINKDIITLTATELKYKSIDGAIFKLIPQSASENAAK